MKVGILRIGQIDQHIANIIRENLEMAFPKTTCVIIPEELSVPKETFNKTRNQYNSEAILVIVRRHAEKVKFLNRILGIVDVDIFVSGLNFVFGEAECPGKSALISLWRLKPEFYGKPPNMNLLLERGTKEAVHELGHTLGLKHCLNPFCVMYFSNSIFETDRKQSLFCNKCHFNVENAIENLR
ncbi:MAG: archaemetzincin family Zn-dependent metalloprotease [Candidatus Bathyarchaeia archaeon]